MLETTQASEEQNCSVDDTDQEQSVSVPLKSNRTKAVIFINVYAFTNFVYSALVKIVVRQKKVDQMDICLIRTFVMLVGSFIFTRSVGASLVIEK